jgi:hypothetical protein
MKYDLDFTLCKSYIFLLMKIGIISTSKFISRLHITRKVSNEIIICFYTWIQPTRWTQQRTKRQTKIFKTLHRKLKFERHQPPKNRVCTQVLRRVSSSRSRNVFYILLKVLCHELTYFEEHRTNGKNICQQIIDIPMETKCASLPVDLFFIQNRQSLYKTFCHRV